MQVPPFSKTVYLWKNKIKNIIINNVFIYVYNKHTWTDTEYVHDREMEGSRSKKSWENSRKSVWASNADYLSSIIQISVMYDTFDKGRIYKY